MKRVFYIVGLGALAPLVAAQPADTVITEAIPLASFTQAVALAADPMGRLYVVDQGRDLFVLLTPEGAPVQTFGGSGTQDGAFLDPSDIDPTNGLVWIVADAGNHRLQRFSLHFLHLESLPVGLADGPSLRGEQPRYGAWRSGIAEDVADGRPIAVVQSPSGDLFAIDEAQRLVLRWDEQRRFAGTLGGYDAGAGALSEPVALAADANALYVADRGTASVVVYDAFGAYARTLAEGRAPEVQALALSKGRLWIVLPHRLLVYDRTGQLETTLDVRLPELLVDVVHRAGLLYLLTPSRLWTLGWE